MVSLSREDFYKNLFCCVANAALNESELENIVHTEFEDLAVILKCRLSESVNFTVTRQILAEMDVEEHAAMVTAAENTALDGFECRRIEDVIENLYEHMNTPSGAGRASDDECAWLPAGGSDIYVLTNRQKVYGAAAIAIPEVMHLADEYLEGTAIVIPSSKHELLIIPEDGSLDLGSLRGIVHEINSNVLLPEDFLSDSIYRYDPSDGRVSLISEQERAYEYC